MPKVSVIIPVYGVEKYIERCARSLFEQTLDDIEYLFIDDCSPDRSVEILRSVIEEFPHRKKQVVIHRMNQNSGQAKVREWGMKNAIGEYVIHCDSDDWVDTEMYQVMYSLARQENSDVTICDFYKATSSRLTRLCGCHDKDLNMFIKNCLFQKESWSLWNKLFKRAIIKESIDYPIAALGEDMYIFFQIISNCKKLSYISKPFYYYRYNENSITKKRTVSNCMYKYTTLKDNTDKLISFLDENFGSLGYINAAKDFLRINNARCLLQALYLPDYRKVWNETCKDVSLMRFLVCPQIGYYHKAIYVLTKIGFLPRKSEWAENV